MAIHFEYIGVQYGDGSNILSLFVKEGGLLRQRSGYQFGIDRIW
jgi:hypothetical protein